MDENNNGRLETGRQPPLPNHGDGREKIVPAVDTTAFQNSETITEMKRILRRN